MGLASSVSEGWRRLKLLGGTAILSAMMAAPCAASLPTRQADPAARIPNLMVHRIGPREDRYTLSEATLERTLKRMDDEGYATVSQASLLEERIDETLPEGRKALAISIDDADGSVIAVERDAAGAPRLDERGTPILKSGTFHDVLNRFADEHPAFGRAYTVYVDFKSDARMESGHGAPFDDAEMGGTLLRLLAEDPHVMIGYHTTSHRSMRRMTLAEFRADLDVWERLYRELTGRDPSEVRVMAYPYGDLPLDKEVQRAIGDRFDSADAAWGGAAPLPGTDEFEKVRFRSPRIELQPSARFGQPDTVALYVEKNTRPYVRTGALAPRKIAEDQGITDGKERGESNESGEKPEARERKERAEELPGSGEGAAAEKNRIKTVTIKSAETIVDGSIAKTGWNDAKGEAMMGLGGLAGLLSFMTRMMGKEPPEPTVPVTVACHVQTRYRASTLSMEEIVTEVKTQYNCHLRQRDVSELGRGGTGATLRTALNEELLTERAVRLYNQAVSCHRAGDYRALLGHAEEAGARLGVSAAAYEAALRRHIIGVQEGRRTGLLERFDQRLLPDPATYAERAADAYLHSPQTLAAVAERMGAETGMRVSPATISRLARHYLRERGEPCGRRPRKRQQAL